jgi:hypothetical protein
MRRALTSALLAVLAAGCTAPLSGAPCPCLPGFLCDAELDICRPATGPGATGDGGSFDGGSFDGGEVVDAASDAGTRDASDCSDLECTPSDAGCDCASDAGCPECPPEVDAGCDCASDGGCTECPPEVDAGPLD